MFSFLGTKSTNTTNTNNEMQGFIVKCIDKLRDIVKSLKLEGGGDETFEIITSNEDLILAYNCFFASWLESQKNGNNYSKIYSKLSASNKKGGVLNMIGFNNKNIIHTLDVSANGMMSTLNRTCGGIKNELSEIKKALSKQDGSHQRLIIKADDNNLILVLMEIAAIETAKLEPTISNSQAAGAKGKVGGYSRTTRKHVDRNGIERTIFVKGDGEYVRVKKAADETGFRYKKVGKIGKKN